MEKIILQFTNLQNVRFNCNCSNSVDWKKQLIFFGMLTSGAFILFLINTVENFRQFTFQFSLSRELGRKIIFAFIFSPPQHDIVYAPESLYLAQSRHGPIWRATYIVLYTHQPNTLLSGSRWSANAFAL